MNILENGQTVTSDILSTYNPTAVPVPSALWLFGSALAGFGLLNRRKTA